MNRCVVFCALFGLMAPLAMSSKALAAEFDLEKSKEVLEKLIEQELADGCASISIALVRGNEIVWKAAYGYANYRMKTPATPDTIYRNASTMKPVTATAILQLIEQGKCKLDDPVNPYLGDVQIGDNEEEPVTFRHLLSHTSGLGALGIGYTSIWSRTSPPTLEELASRMASVRPVESKFVYLNSGYSLAGLLIEKISGMSFEDYVVRNIFKPLGVKTLHPFEPDAEMVERMALPYSRTPEGEPGPVSQVRFTASYPAGGVYLTAEDMARFLAAHLNGGEFQGARILEEESVKEAHTKQFFDYGLGWRFRQSEDGNTIIQHGGEIPGMIAFMAGDLDAKVGVYVMSNSGDPRAICKAALTVLRGEPYTGERKEITLDAAQLVGLPGVYEAIGQGKVFVTSENGRLFFQPRGMGRKLVLHPNSEIKFYIKEIGAEVIFNRDATGEVQSITVIQQSGMTTEGKRVGDVPSGERK